MSSSTSTLNRMTFLMMLLIISRCGLICGLQLIFRIDKKTPEADNLIALRQPLLDRCIKFTLNTGLDFDRDVLAGLLLDVNDAFRALLDDGFIGNGEEFTPLGNDLHYITGAVFAACAGKRNFNHNAVALRGNFGYPRLEHR